jgi:TPR repeat protein
MTRVALRLTPSIAACIAGALAIVVIQPARADFARLQWQYECLKDPDAVCFDATPSGVDPLAPKAAPAAAPADEFAASARAAVMPPEPPAPKLAAKSTPAAVADQLGALVGRLRAGKPTTADMATLQTRARTGNARALELLGWAELVGVGVPRDPVQAYFHYGMAAAAGLSTGRRDQAAIFSGSLTNEERQEILVIENGNIEAGHH